MVTAQWLRIQHRVLSKLHARFPSVDIVDLEDACQEAFERWLSHPPHLEHPSETETSRWLSTVASNALIDVLRRRRWNVPLPENANGIPDTTTPCDEMEMHDLLQYAMLQLGRHSYPQIVATVFHNEFDRTFDCIAANLGCSVPAARMHHSRGKAFLKKIIGEQLGLHSHLLRSRKNH